MNYLLYSLALPKRVDPLKKVMIVMLATFFACAVFTMALAYFVHIMIRK